MVIFLSSVPANMNCGKQTVHSESPTRKAKMTLKVETIRTIII